MTTVKGALRTAILVAAIFAPGIATAAIATTCAKTTLIPVVLLGQVPNPTARCTLSWSVSDHHPNYHFAIFGAYAGGVANFTEETPFIVQNNPQRFVALYLRWAVPGFYLVNSEARFWFSFVGGENGLPEFVDHPQNPVRSSMIGLTLP
jgi:hypothetical protein